MPLTSIPHRAHVLDKLIGDVLPTFATPADIAAFEAQAPYAERVAALNTWQALQLGSAIDPDAPAIVFLPDLERAAEPDSTAVTLSHAQLQRQLVQCGNLFHSLGVGQGGVVSMLLPLLPQAFVALYGAQTVGIANPVNPLLSAGQLAEILHAAGTRVLVTLGPTPGSDIWEKVLAIRDQLPQLKRVLVVGGAAHPETIADNFDTLLAAQPSERLLSGREPAPDDICGYFHTGGTTGTPKLVRHTHANQVSQAWALRLTRLVGPGEALLYGLPLFHVGGALTQGLASLANGGHLVVLGAAGWRDPRALPNVWRLVQRFKPRVFSGVPTVMAAALQVPRGDVDVGSVQLVFGGGSAIPVALINAYQEQLGAPVVQGYGMTETASVSMMAYPDMPISAGSVGRPLPHWRVRVVRVDADGRCTQDCATNEIGVVAVAGPGVFGGYLSDKHNEGAFIAPGWVNSGDLGRLDEHGELWLTGRAKDLIIRGSHNIDPAPLEELLHRHPAVALAALVGQPDAYAGELPAAYVQLKVGAQISAAELIGYLKEGTPERAAVPVVLHFVDSMPLTAVGKIFKPELRAHAMKHVAEDLLRNLPGSGEGCTVTVRQDAIHGQIIHVALRCEGDAARKRLANGVAEQLGPLATRHEVT